MTEIETFVVTETDTEVKTEAETKPDTEAEMATEAETEALTEEETEAETESPYLIPDPTRIDLRTFDGSAPFLFAYRPVATQENNIYYNDLYAE